MQILVDLQAWRNSARRDRFSRNLLLERGEADITEEGKAVWTMDSLSSSSSSSRPPATTSPGRRSQSIMRRPQTFTIPSILRNTFGRPSTSARRSTDSASFWTSIHATSPRVSQLTLPLMTPRLSSEPPNYSFENLRAAEPENSQTSSSRSASQSEHSSAREEASESVPSTADGSLHFSDRVEAEVEQMEGADVGFDVESLISRATAQQEERFNKRLEEQAQRFEALISQAAGRSAL